MGVDIVFVEGGYNYHSPRDRPDTIGGTVVRAFVRVYRRVCVHVFVPDGYNYHSPRDKPDSLIQLEVVLCVRACI